MRPMSLWYLKYLRVVPMYKLARPTNSISVPPDTWKYTKPKWPACFSVLLNVITGGAMSHHAKALDRNPRASKLFGSASRDELEAGVDIGWAAQRRNSDSSSVSNTLSRIDVTSGK